MSETRKLLLEKDGPIGWIVFNQPEKRNAVSLEMWQLMPDYVKDLANDDAIRVVVLRGAGDQAFVAGADISQFKERRRNMADQEEYSRISERGQSALGTLTKPLLAMIHGYCVGGGVGIAIGCDMRIVSDDAHVAADGDADAAADAVAVDHREQRLGEGTERALPALRDPAVLFLVGHVAPPLLELGDVRAGHERLVAGAAQDDDTDRVVVGEVLDVVGHELPHLEAHRVALLGLVEDDPADRSVFLQQELPRLAHGALLVGGSRQSYRASRLLVQPGSPVRLRAVEILHPLTERSVMDRWPDS